MLMSSKPMGLDIQTHVCGSNYHPMLDHGIQGYARDTKISTRLDYEVMNYS